MRPSGWTWPRWSCSEIVCFFLRDSRGSKWRMCSGTERHRCLGLVKNVEERAVPSRPSGGGRRVDEEPQGEGEGGRGQEATEKML